MATPTTLQIDTVVRLAHRADTRSALLALGADALGRLASHFRFLREPL
jgi:hypothetical protein